MKKVLVSILAVIGIVAVIGVSWYFVWITEEKPGNTRVIKKNGGEELYINVLFTHGKYTVSCLFLENDGVMLSDNPNNAHSIGVTFTPQKSGHCIIVAEDYFCSNVEGARIFDVTVDENLKISYTFRNVEKFFYYKCIDFENCQMTVQKDGNSTAVQKQTAVEIGNEMNRIYGKDTAGIIDPDLSRFAKIKVTCADNIVFYISDEKIYYQVNGIENWWEFVPDEICSLDGIIELLDLRD